ncbi:glycoside hydrolase family 20 zincin-like fold domain-containing protein, partial [Gemmiger sp.]|uniref:glycoside hydrolase family 20 zincin-like fold domain-containing protein n=1 Tax=Gemmiger sp. TaxID=2049027 RepID=UPI003AB24EE6
MRWECTSLPSNNGASITVPSLFCRGDQSEGYQLDVTPGGIDLRAGSPDGLFYGMQTLR